VGGQRRPIGSKSAWAGSKCIGRGHDRKQTRTGLKCVGRGRDRKQTQTWLGGLVPVLGFWG
jgi:hypothetical protein